MGGNERELRSIGYLQHVDCYDTRFFLVFSGGSIESNLGPGLVLKKFSALPREAIYELKSSAQRKNAFQLLPREHILE